MKTMFLNKKTVKKYKKYTKKQLIKEIDYLYNHMDVLNDVIYEKRHNFKSVQFEDNKKTTITWNDGTKTSVSVAEGDTFDPIVGFALCYLKKEFGDRYLSGFFLGETNYEDYKYVVRELINGDLPFPARW